MPSPADEQDKRSIISLKAIFSRYKGADGRGRHEIFRDIFWLGSSTGAGRSNLGLPAHDAEQTLVSGIEPPDPEFPVVATSAITVPNFIR